MFLDSLQLLIQLHHDEDQKAQFLMTITIITTIKPSKYIKSRELYTKENS